MSLDFDNFTVEPNVSTEAATVPSVEDLAKPFMMYKIGK